MISLSFDTDHMNEARMVEFLAEVTWPGGATFFCTQPYGCLGSEENFELAPHPLLTGDRNWLAELKAKRAEFPNALGWRAHSCVFSHTLAEWISCNGYLYASTHDSFGEAGIKPNRHLWGVWHVPIYYMDNLDFSRNRFAPERKERPFARSLIETACRPDGLYVFDFHPIHLVLNTPDPDWYSVRRAAFLAGEKSSILRYNGYGARSFFDELVAAMKHCNQSSVSILEALRAYLGERLEPRDPASLPYAFDEARLGL
jgi:hypothetical protein